ncbi:TonB-dependent siderophore receptor [Pararobbsia silviterrae]|uniref:TonB-dependent siderophore receptor n=1 Tax=Pararobbsia silviterrae TaxID=1792498 RepID=A0A494XRM5_9BURK|nr:TonB-dependent siderophore receptor [Pararobbsia silviterrae]RKP53278.1 TonB-dependent siderophore receptor [Pararobbsia silviterrae]
MSNPGRLPTLSIIDHAGTSRGTATSFRPRPLAFAVAAALCGAGLLAAYPATTYAQTAANQAAPATEQTFDIPAGPLAPALRTLASSFNVLLTFTPDQTEGKRTAGIKGRYAPQAALEALLAGSGLEAVRLSNGGYVLKAKPVGSNASTVDEGVLPIVTVRPSGEGSDSGNTAERLNPSSTIGSKIPVSQREIPQSVSVITQEQIQQQQMNTVDDALRYVPGLKTFDGQYFSRGYEITTEMLDGVPTTFPTSIYAGDPALLGQYDRVEILRGPSGLYNLFGGAGGTLNLVRKMPTDDFHFSGQLSGGSDSTAIGQMDVSGPLNSTGTLRGRFVASGLTENLDSDGRWKNDQQFYGVVQADLAPRTTLTLGASYDRMEEKSALFSGVPGYSDYRLWNVSPTRNLSPSWNVQRAETTSVFSNLETKLDNGWKGEIAFNYQNQSRMSKYSSIPGAIDATTNTVGIYSAMNHVDDQQYGVDGFLSGPIELLGRTHILTVGTTYSRETTATRINYCSQASLFCATTLSLNDLGPNAIPEPDFDGPVLGQRRTTEQYGVYGNARISLLDALTLVVGARGTWWKTNLGYVAGENPFDGSSSDGSYDGKVTPYAGLIYDINNNLSAYVSYTSVFQPQTSYTSSDQLLKPVEGNQYEIGLKGEFYGGKLNTSAALFQITQENQAMQDPNDPTGQYSVASGKSRSQGLELTASGEVLSGLTLFGGYTYTDTQLLDDSGTGFGTEFNAVAPKHLLKLWTAYQLPGQWNKWTIGAGTYVSSKISYTDGIGSWVQGGYATVDAMVSYRLDKRTTLALSGTNLFNRTYYDTVGGDGNNLFGNLRRVLFTVRYQM